MVNSRHFWLIAPFQLFLFVFLIWFGCPYKATWFAWMESTAVHESKPGSMGSLVFEDLDLVDEPYLEQLAVGLNAPAAFAGSVIAGCYDWILPNQLSGAKHELISHGITAILVPILWLLLRGALERVRTNAPRISSPFLIVCGIASIIIIGFIAFLIVISYFVPEGQPLLLLKILILAWITTMICLMLARMRSPIMKAAHLIRLMNSVAVAICIGNWFLIFLHVSIEKAWEWNTFTLLDLARFMSLRVPSDLMTGHSPQIIAVSACAAGCLPIITGLFGSVWPKSKSLLPIAVIVAAVVLASVVSIHMVMAALYGYEKRSIVQSDIGVYVVMVVVIIEICAGVFSRMKERQNN